MDTPVTPPPPSGKDYLRSLLSRPWTREDYDFAIKFLGILAAVLLFGMRECRTREGVAASKRLKEDEMTLLRIENVHELDSINTSGLHRLIFDSLQFRSRKVEHMLSVIDESSKAYEHKVSRLRFHNPIPTHCCKTTGRKYRRCAHL